MQVIAIDARNCMYKFSWTGKNLHAVGGQPTGALHGILVGMLALKRRSKDAKFVVVWDGWDTIHSWRGRLYPGYKANRRMQPSPAMEELRDSVTSQIKIAKEMLTTVGIPQIEVGVLEADDVIGVLSEKCQSRGWRFSVYSSDQDYHQLMAYGVQIIPNASGPPITAREVESKWRCPLDKILKLRSLLGDVSDDIPRPVSGVGPVAAARYIESGVDPSLPKFDLLLRSVREECERLRDNWAAIHMNWRLMWILRSVSDPEMPSDIAAHVKLETRRVLHELAGEPSRDSERYGEMVALMARMDLAAAIQNRNEIWRLQIA